MTFLKGNKIIKSITANSSHVELFNISSVIGRESPNLLENINWKKDTEYDQ